MLATNTSKKACIQNARNTSIFLYLTSTVLPKTYAKGLEGEKLLLIRKIADSF